MLLGKNLMKIQLKHILLCVAASFILVACGSGGGESTTGNPDIGTPTINNQSCGSLDPAPATADINSFCNEFWSQSNLQANCTTCHNPNASIPQTPYFMHDDINQAYAAANSVVDTSNAAQSTIVLKVLGPPGEGNGHNCWATDQVCADLMTGYIDAWLGDSAGSSTEIPLTAPTNPQPPGSGKEFPPTATTPANPADPGSTFEQLIFNPILVPYCASCHTNGPGDPLFANPGSVESSYEAAIAKMNLDVPGSSRLVVKLPTETHNCFSVNNTEFPGITVTGDDCVDSAAVMEDAITRFAEFIPTTAVNSSIVSRAMKIPDGIVASGGARYEANQIALYEFKSGVGTTAYDTSGSDPINLTFSSRPGDEVTWVGGWGVKIGTTGYLQGGATKSKKLYDLIQATGEYSIEAWVAPNNVTQEMARIVNYGAGVGNRNLSLSQTQYNYDFQSRSSNTDLDGEPAVSTPDAAEALQATLQHVVATYSPAAGRKIYVNDVLQTALDPQAGGSLNSWSNAYSLVLGNEPAGGTANNNLWRGTFKLVSIHNRELSEAQINQNFVAGVGEKFFLLFDISHITGVPAQSYIMFLVNQFDDYSYLFTEPKFISLDPGLGTVNIPIKGMRIGINSKESPVGQAYVNIDTFMTASDQLLSDIGTTIPLEINAIDDEFFLTFEALGNQTQVYVEPTFTPQTPVEGNYVSDIGLKTFDEINETMALMTGGNTDAASYKQSVSTTYNLVKQQLPASPDINTFVTAHNIGITQLAMDYCDVLVQDAAAGDTNTIFGNFNFGQNAALAFADPSLVIDPLLTAMNGTGLDLQMDDGTFAVGGTVPDAYPTGVDTTFTTKSELINLITNLNGCVATTCNTVDQTLLVSKAVCTATLAGANTIIK